MTAIRRILTPGVVLVLACVSTLGCRTTQTQSTDPDISQQPAITAPPEAPAAPAAPAAPEAADAPDAPEATDKVEPLREPVRTVPEPQVVAMVPAPQPEPAPPPTPKLEPKPAPQPKLEPKPAPKPAPVVESKREPVAKPVPTPEPKPAPSPAPVPEVVPVEPAPTKPAELPVAKPAPAPVPTPEPVAAPTPEPAPAPTPKPKVEPKPKPEPPAMPQVSPPAPVAPAPKPAPIAPTPEPEPQPKPRVEPKPEPKLDPQPDPKPHSQPELTPAPQPEPVDLPRLTMVERPPADRTDAWAGPATIVKQSAVRWPEPTADKTAMAALEGAWAEAATDRLLHLSANRFREADSLGVTAAGRWVSDGKHLTAKQLDGTVRHLRIVSRTHGKLVLADGSATHAFTRLDAVPAVFAGQATTVPEPGPIEPRRLRLIQETLVAHRAAWRKALKSRPKLAEAVARENSLNLSETVAEVGWIDSKRFGAVYAQYALLIADTGRMDDLLAAVLPLVEKDVEADRFDAELYAQVADRYALRRGNPQPFGTQRRASSGVSSEATPILAHLTDLASVNTARHRIGLPPLDDRQPHVTLDDFQPEP